MQLWQYATPVAYGLALIPKRIQYLYLLNPITTVITTFRYAFFGEGYFEISTFITSWIITLVILMIGIILFNKVEKTFMDTV